MYQFLENNGKPAGRRVHHGAEVVCCPAQGERAKKHVKTGGQVFEGKQIRI